MHLEKTFQEFILESAVKVAIWSNIGGAAVTAFTLYRGHRYAQEHKNEKYSWLTGYVLPILFIPITFRIGGVLGGGMKILQITYQVSPEAFGEIVRSPIKITKWLFT